MPIGLYRLTTFTRRESQSIILFDLSMHEIARVQLPHTNHPLCEFEDIIVLLYHLKYSMLAVCDQPTRESASRDCPCSPARRGRSLTRSRPLSGVRTMGLFCRKEKAESLSSSGLEREGGCICVCFGNSAT
jgi:hypothetical protein